MKTCVVIFGGTGFIGHFLRRTFWSWIVGIRYICMILNLLKTK